MKKLTCTFRTLIIAGLSLTLFSCASSVKEVPENLSAAQIIQQGQNYYESGKYKTAILFYQAAIDRYGSTNGMVYLEAKYELGHTYLKQHKYEAAYDTFNEILDIYDQYAGQIPGTYKKLAELGLERIGAKRIEQVKAAKEERIRKLAEEKARKEAEEREAALKAQAEAEALEKAEREAAKAAEEAEATSKNQNEETVSESSETSDEVIEEPSDAASDDVEDVPEA